MQTRPTRSALYIPGSKPRALDKARGLTCDVILFDLEDAVAPDAKIEARSTLHDALAQGGYGGRLKLVRINGLDTDWGADDARAAAKMPCDGVLVPKVSSPADLDAVADLVPDLPLWAMMEEAGVPVTLHIGSGQNMPSVYMNTGTERVLAGNIGNIETTKPKDLPVIHHTIERWITCMIFDGVLERFPKLKIGIIELGANWVPASLMNLDMGVSLLGKFDQSLKKLSMKPSEYFERQIRVAPLHTENTGWILKNVGKNILMFNTDYPHPEGGKDPFGDFEESLDAVEASTEELDRFYSKNYEDYLGL